MYASRTTILAGVLSATMLAGCGGRDANPVSLALPTDSMLTCPLILAEMSGNNDRAVSLMEEKQDAQDANVAIGAAGALLLFPPAWFFMDLTDTEDIEMRALRDRNNYLTQLAVAQDCGPVPAASPQEAGDEALDERIAAARAGGGMPNCSEVGGYEEYMRRTNEACRLDH